MDKHAPLDFDISVAADKKRRQRGRRSASGAVETSSRECEHPGCSRKGKFRAPKSPYKLDEFHWFCREHARKYNLQWDYFKRQSEEQIEESLRSERDRSKRKNADEHRAWQRHGVTDPLEILGDKGTLSKASYGTTGRRLSPEERRALKILDADHSWDRSKIKERYSSLVKYLHPDLNAGDRSEEGRLNEVKWAWEQIKSSSNFRD